MQTTMQNTATYLITVTTRKEVTHLPEKIGSRVWMIEGVEDVKVQPVQFEGHFRYLTTPTGPAV